MQNYRREHLVPFYADQLNITTQYLSSVIKSLTGRTPSQFIFERLYCEARALLDHPDLSIKEIAELLHFSDQSAFGKFSKNDTDNPLSITGKDTLFKKPIFSRQSVIQLFPHVHS